MSSGCGHSGLSGLVKKCLGKQLDKSHQLSDWERRPLHKEKIIYAGKEYVLCCIHYKYIVSASECLRSHLAYQMGGCKHHDTGTVFFLSDAHLCYLCSCDHLQ